MKKEIVDVVILSYTKNDKFFAMTKHCMESLHESESNYQFDIHLVETSNDLSRFDYSPLVTSILQPGIPFNYNQYLNQILPKCKSNHVVIMNNDVLCHKGWFTEIVKQMEQHNLDSASPKCPLWEAHRPFTEGVVYGFDSGVHFCGWCLVLTQATLQHILPLDETFSFWFQDNDMAQFLRCTKKKHALITSALMTHLESQSHELLDDRTLVAQTHGLRQAFADKWGI